MKYFNSAFIQFFKELSNNNNKQWFDANKAIYEKEVKKPFLDFTGIIITRIQEHDHEVQISPAEAVFRINRDIRFSPDKTPYKTHAAANISKYGRKDNGYPGLYYQMSHEGLMIYGGVYTVEKDRLSKIRNYIAENLDDFAEVYNDSAFIEKFGEIQGEKNKRLSPELQGISKHEPLIANKQFYFGAELNKKFIISDELPDVIMEYYMAGKKVNDFLKEAVK
jgi:uncharacterized protein (TIGR02453 family)